jgi:hypothetical protein
MYNYIKVVLVTIKILFYYQLFEFNKLFRSNIENVIENRILLGKFLIKLNNVLSNDLTY